MVWLKCFNLFFEKRLKKSDFNKHFLYKSACANCGNTVMDGNLSPYIDWEEELKHQLDVVCKIWNEKLYIYYSY